MKSSFPPPSSLLFILWAVLCLFPCVGCTQFHRLKQPEQFTDLQVPRESSSPKPVLSLPAGEISLAEVQRLALHNNPSLKAMRAHLAAATSRVRAVLFEYYPSLRVSGGFSRYWNKDRMLPAREGDSPLFGLNVFWGDITLRVPLYTGGSTKKSANSLLVLQRAEGEALKRATRKMRFALASTWYSLLYNTARKRDLKQQIHNVARLVALGEALVAEKKVAQLHLDTLKVRLAKLRSRLEEVQGARTLLWSTLCTLMAVPHHEKTPPPLPQLQAPPVGKSLLASYWIKRAFANRSDLKALAYKIRGRSLALKAKGAHSRPRIYGIATWGYRMNTEWDGGSTGFAGIVLSWDILDLFRASAGVEEEQSRLEALKHEVRSLKLQIEQSVRGALIAYRTAFRGLKSASSTVALARKNYHITLAKTRISMAATTELLVSQNELLGVLDQYNRALMSCSIALARLKLAVGE